MQAQSYSTKEAVATAQARRIKHLETIIDTARREGRIPAKPDCAWCGGSGEELDTDHHSYHGGRPCRCLTFPPPGPAITIAPDDEFPF